MALVYLKLSGSMALAGPSTRLARKYVLWQDLFLSLSMCQLLHHTLTLVHVNFPCRKSAFYQHDVSLQQLTAFFLHFLLGIAVFLFLVCSGC